MTGERRSSLGAVESWRPRKERLPLMEAPGIDLRVLSLDPQLIRGHRPAAPAIACARAADDEIAETLRETPDRCASLATPPLQDPAAAAREIEGATTGLGLAGCIVGSRLDEANRDDPSPFPVLEAAESLGAFILLHPVNGRIGTPLPGHPMVKLIGTPLGTRSAAASPILGGVADRLPRLGVCLSHAGGYQPFAVGRFGHGERLREEVRAVAAQPPSDRTRLFRHDCIAHSDEGFERVPARVGRLTPRRDAGTRSEIAWNSSSAPRSGRSSSPRTPSS